MAAHVQHSLIVSNHLPIDDDGAPMVLSEFAGAVTGTERGRSRDPARP